VKLKVLSAAAVFGHRTPSLERKESGTGRK